MLNYQLILEKLQLISDMVSEYLLDNFEKFSKDCIFYKEDGVEIVTQIDLDIENKTISFLKDFFPEALFISEESQINNKIDNSKELIFIIDPIDGTSNYVYGIEYFCFSIGVMSFGKFIGGAISAPILDEMFFAMESFGAFYKHHDKIVSFEEILRNRRYHEHKYLIGTTYPCINLIYNKLSKKVSVRIFGSTAITVCYSLIGKLDGVISNCTKLWDVAGALGIASVIDANFMFKYNEEAKNYSLILHRDRKELQNLKEILNF